VEIVHLREDNASVRVKVGRGAGMIQHIDLFQVAFREPALEPLWEDAALFFMKHLQAGRTFEDLVLWHRPDGRYEVQTQSFYSSRELVVAARRLGISKIQADVIKGSKDDVVEELMRRAFERD
jgi:hypothetical protein